jgi:hypothetical protein
MVEFVDAVMNLFHDKFEAGELPDWLHFFDAAHDAKDHNIADIFGHFSKSYKRRVAHRVQSAVVELLSSF